MVFEGDAIDVAMLSQLQELLGPRFAELIDRFEEDGGRRLELLRVAVANTDFETVHAEAHGLKGSSRNMGANALANICNAMEEQGRRQSAAQMQQTLAAIEQEFADACQQIKRYLG